MKYFLAFWAPFVVVFLVCIALMLWGLHELSDNARTISALRAEISTQDALLKGCSNK